MHPTVAALAVIIPHYNDERRLRHCLDALCAQDLTGVEVAVVDNGTPNFRAEWLSEYPNVLLVVEVGKGAALARNRGVYETSAAKLAFLDADCVPAPDWVSRALATDEASITGGRIVLFDETPPPQSGAEVFEAVFAFDQLGYLRNRGFFVTANLIVPRSVFMDVGEFRTGVSEDLDWCHRATARAHTLVYSSELVVRHPSRSDWSALERKWRRLTREAFGLTEHNICGRLVWAGRALLMLPSVVAHAPRIMCKKELTFAEKRAGVTILARLRLARMLWMLRQAASGLPEV